MVAIYFIILYNNIPKKKNFTSSDPNHDIYRFVTGIPSDILSGISSGILSGISHGILSGISSGILSDILSGISSGILPCR